LELPDVDIYLGGFSSDGTKIVTTCDDKTARIWDVESGEVLQTLTGLPTLMGDSEGIESTSFSHDGKKIVIASWAAVDDEENEDMSRIVGSVQIWDTESGKELHKFTDSCSPQYAALSPDGKKVATIFLSVTIDLSIEDYIVDYTIQIWDVESWKELQKMTEAEDFIVFSPDGRKFVSSGAEHSALIWDVESGKKLHKLQMDAVSNIVSTVREFSSLGAPPYHSTPRVRSATFSPDGKKIVTASSDGTVRIWTLE
jgi:WD40 repeat protein